MARTKRLLPSDCWFIQNQVRNLYRPYLTPAQYLVLDFIIDRTIGWGKLNERISISQIIEGVCSPEEEEYHATPCRLSKNTVHAALQHLIEFEFVIAIRSSSRVNDAPILGLPIDPSSRMLRLSKKAKSSHEVNAEKLRAPQGSELHLTRKIARFEKAVEQQKQQNVSQNLGCAYPNDWDAKEKRKKRRRVNTSPVSEGPQAMGKKEEKKSKDEIEEKVRALQAKLSGKREQKRMSALEKAEPSLSEIAIVWQNALTSTFEDRPFIAWGKREQGTMMGLLRRYRKGSEKKPFGAFIDWSVRYWRFIVGSRFANLRNAPQFPEVGFFARFIGDFLESFARADEAAYLTSFTPIERRIHELLQQNYTFEAARQVAEEELGLSEKRRANEKAAARLQRERIAMERTQRASSMLELATRTPRAAKVQVLAPNPRFAEMAPKAEVDESFGPWKD